MRNLKRYFSRPFYGDVGIQLVIGALLSLTFLHSALACRFNSMNYTPTSCGKLNEVTFCACRRNRAAIISIRYWIPEMEYGQTLPLNGSLVPGCANIVQYSSNCPLLFEDFVIVENSLNTFQLNNTEPVIATFKCGVRETRLRVHRIKSGNLEICTNVTVVGELKQVSISLDGIPPDCYRPVNSNISVTDDNGSVYIVEPISLTNSEVILSLPKFNDHHVTIDNVTFVGRDGKETVLPSHNISLFDIQNLTANNCSMPNKVDVYLEYAKNTSAPGALVMLVPYNQDGSLDFTNAYYYILPRNLSSSYRRVSVSGGSFKVFAIDLENSIILRENTTAADTQIVTDVSGDEMNSTYPTDSEHIEVSVSGEGSVVVTCADESKNSLVAVPLKRGLTRPGPNITNSNGSVVYLELDGANGLTSFVVFTWDKSGEFIDAVVSLVSTYVRPTDSIPTPYGNEGFAGFIGLVVFIVMVVLGAVVLGTVVLGAVVYKQCKGCSQIFFYTLPLNNDTTNHQTNRQNATLESVPPPAEPNSVSRPHNGSSENIPETQTNSDDIEQDGISLRKRTVPATLRGSPRTFSYPDSAFISESATASFTADCQSGPGEPSDQTPDNVIVARSDVGHANDSEAILHIQGETKCLCVKPSQYQGHFSLVQSQPKDPQLIVKYLYL